MKMVAAFLMIGFAMKPAPLAPTPWVAVAEWFIRTAVLMLGIAFLILDDEEYRKSKDK